LLDRGAEIVQDRTPTNDALGLASPHFTAAAESPEFAAWEEIDAGRYMPRRVRGSYQGRALG